MVLIAAVQDISKERVNFPKRDAFSVHILETELITSKRFVVVVVVARGSQN